MTMTKGKVETWMLRPESWLKNISRNPIFKWSVKGRSLGGERPLVMGILNVTPDSFFDGGMHLKTNQAVEHAVAMCDQGADIIDVGGESTRPGAKDVSADEQCHRVIPVIKEIANRSEIPVSIDTRDSIVARQAIQAGAVIVNDVDGFVDTKMMDLVVESGVSAVINHMPGNPRTMQSRTGYSNVMKDVQQFLLERVNLFGQKGVNPEKLAVDPGIGFGKTVNQNHYLIANLSKLHSIGCPVLMGMSRKSFIAKTRGLENSDRFAPSLASALFAAYAGASVLRVHDVRATWEAMRLWEALLGEVDE